MFFFLKKKNDTINLSQIVLAGILSLTDWFKKHQIHFPNPYGHKALTLCINKMHGQRRK